MMEHPIKNLEDLYYHIPALTLPIFGFRNQNFHLLVAAPSLKQLIDRKGLDIAGIVGGYAGGYAVRTAAGKLADAASDMTGIATSPDSIASQAGDMFKSLFSFYSKFHHISVIMPRFTYLTSLHFFGVQPLNFKGFTELKDKTVDSFNTVMHRVLTPWEFILFNHPVHAAADGEIIEVINDYNDKVHRTSEVNFSSVDVEEFLGNRIRIKHNSFVRSIYGGLKRNSMRFRVGDKVRRGEHIANVGTSGTHTSPYLYFQLEYVGPRIPIAGNLSIPVPKINWDSFFQCPLTHLNMHGVPEFGIDDFEVHKIKYIPSFHMFREACLVKRFPTISIE